MNNRNTEEAWHYHNKTKHPGMPTHYLDWANQPIPITIDECVPDLKTLGRLLYLSAGITKKVNYPGGEIHFRAAACTGALYHIDLYIVTRDIEGLEAGVYHFGPHDFSLRTLRKGNLLGVIMSATG